MISHFFTAPFVRSPKRMESLLSRCPGKDLIRDAIRGFSD